MRSERDQPPSLIAEAQTHLRGVLHPAIWNHSQRVERLCFALRAGGSVAIDTALDLAFDVEALSVAALFHDAGTASEHDGPDRFEVEGAHAAARFLERHGWEPVRIKPVWDAIALHTSPGIAENAGVLPAIVRAAVRTDFGAPLPDDVQAADSLIRLKHELPREHIERVLAAEVIAQVDRSDNPDRKAPPTSWAAHLLAGRDAVDPVTGVNPNF